MDYFSKIDINNTPKHVAIIMDGNGRWAKKQSQKRLFGHDHGAESVRRALEAVEKTKVEYLTLYTFSKENWNRPKEEVEGIMRLLVHTLVTELPNFLQNNVKLLAIGDTDELPADCREELLSSIAKTKDNTGIKLILALNYSSRWEIVNALKSIATEAANKQIRIEDINEQLISNYLTTNSIPDPDLLIRTSGEHRISNFLLWQIAYSELHFTDVLWPDFSQEDFYKAIVDYQMRERRFGMVSEQFTQ
ncbi:MAG: isoprenyl transferase [Bacteroidota bacterium]